MPICTFRYIKVGYKGVYTTRSCYPDCLQTAEFSEADGIEYSRMLYCGYIEENEPIRFDGETSLNTLIIEFRSDNTTKDPYRKHTGFNITYVQRKRKILSFLDGDVPLCVCMPPTSKKLRGHIGLGLSVQCSE